jgi:hypothetical protein
MNPSLKPRLFLLRLLGTKSSTAVVTQATTGNGLSANLARNLELGIGKQSALANEFFDLPEFNPRLPIYLHHIRPRVFPQIRSHQIVIPSIFL